MSAWCSVSACVAPTSVSRPASCGGVVVGQMQIEMRGRLAVDRFRNDRTRLPDGAPDIRRSQYPPHRARRRVWWCRCACSSVIVPHALFLATRCVRLGLICSSHRRSTSAFSAIDVQPTLSSTFATQSDRCRSWLRTRCAWPCSAQMRCTLLCCCPFLPPSIARSSACLLTLLHVFSTTLSFSALSSFASACPLSPAPSLLSSSPDVLHPTSLIPTPYLPSPLLPPLFSFSSLSPSLSTLSHPPFKFRTEPSRLVVRTSDSRH